jgi:hypothetical protein
MNEPTKAVVSWLFLPSREIGKTQQMRELDFDLRGAMSGFKPTPEKPQPVDCDSCSKEMRALWPDVYCCKKSYLYSEVLTGYD